MYSLIVFTTFYCCLLCFDLHKGVTDISPNSGVYSDQMLTTDSLVYRLILPLGRAGLLLKL